MTTRPTTRKEQQARTRRRLLRSAERLIGSRGIDWATIDRIAADAGYTKGAFYANFGSKEELLMELLDERFARELERLDELFAERGDSMPEEPGEVGREMMRLLVAEGDFQAFFFEYTAHAARDPRFRRELAKREQALQARVGERIERRAERVGLPIPIPPLELATMIFCMMNGFVLERMLRPELSEALYGSMLGTFLFGMYARAAVGEERAGAEIERKFLVDEVPADAPDGEAITQGYVPLEAEDAELRLRRRSGALAVTVKRGRGMARDERELRVLPPLFEALWPLTEGRRIEKERTRIPHGELVIEVDRYRGPLEGLVVAEVEFPSQEQAEQFEAPDWFGREVTGEAPYRNRELAERGAPDPESRAPEGPRR